MKVERVMKILVVSDKEVPALRDEPNHPALEGLDCIISCGDLCASYLNSLANKAQVPLFYVAGNHDFHYRYERPKGTNLDMKIVEFKGLRLVGFQGSMRYNHKAYQYTEAQMKKRVRHVQYRLLFNRHVDIVVTHSPPAGIYSVDDICHQGFFAYRKFIEKYEPRYFLHGHFHLDYLPGLSRRENILGNTKIINCVGFYVLEINQVEVNGLARPRA